MKVKLHKLGLGLAASVVLFAALPAHAANKYGCIYAVDPWDRIVKDPYGRCIRTPYWTADKDVAECGGGQLLDVAQLGRNAGSSNTLAGVERHGGNIGHGIGSFSRIAISTVTRAFIATARPMRMVR